MSNKSGETIDWNRTPGKPSFSNNVPPNPQGQFLTSGNIVEEMWGGIGSILAPQRASNKSWSTNPHDLADPSAAFLNSSHHQNSLGPATAWNNSSNNAAPVNNPFPMGIPPWGGPNPASNPSGMRPIRGPQQLSQPMIPSVENPRNSRQFSGWGPVENIPKEENFNNIDPINTNLISSAGSNASSSSNRNSKDPSKPESSLTLLNELLSNMTNGDGTHSMDLEEIIKSLINVNEAWGQKTVDQTTSWDITSINQDENSNVANPITAQATPTTNNPNTTGPHNHQASTGSVQNQQQIQQQRRIKPMSHAISGASAGQIESNVWQNEPPNGTGIWEAHYESLGEKNSLQWAATGNTIHQSTSAMNPIVTQKAAPINRPMSFSDMNRQSNVGYRSQVAGVPSSGWNDIDTNNIWNTNQHPEMLMNSGMNASGRPINKVGSTTAGMRSGNAPWPPSTNQPPPGNDVYSPTTWNPQSSLNLIIGPDNRKYPNQPPNAGSAGGVGSGGAGGGMWPPDFRSMIQHPPPTNSTTIPGGRPMRGNAPGTGLSSMSQQPQQPPQNPNNSMSSGFFRVNVLRQLIKLGFSEEEVQNTMVENNMDIERTVNDLRSKSAHIGIDALLNPIMGSNLFPVNSVSPTIDGSDYNKVSPVNTSANDPNIKIFEIRQQINHLKRINADLHQKISELVLYPTASSSLAVRELTRRRDQNIQQLIMYESQIQSLRKLGLASSTNTNRSDDLSERIGEMRLKPPACNNTWETNTFWSNPPDLSNPSDATSVSGSNSGASLAPGADRRWSNNDPVVVPSCNTQQIINRQPWPSKTNSQAVVGNNNEYAI